MGLGETNESDLYKAPESNVLKENQEGFDVTNIFNPKGRTNRLGYLAYSMGATFAIMLIFGILGGIIWALGGGEEAIPVVILVAYIPMIVVTFIFAIRRFHDIDWSGWWVVATMIPLLNIVFALILLFKGGTAGSNRFGNPPKPVGALATVFVILFFAVFVLGIVAAIAVPAYQDYLNAAQGAQQLQQ